jgi:hypothetical protein
MRKEMLFLAVLATLASPAAAQQRQGALWVGGGAGGGHTQIDCSMCGPLAAGDPWLGGTGWGPYVSAGGAIIDNLLLGLELNEFGRAAGTSEREASIVTLLVTAQYFPLAGSGLFLKVGAGPGLYSLVDYYYISSFMGRASIGLDAGGWALQGGAGYEHLLGRKIALVPFVNVLQLIASGEKDGITGAAVAPSHPRYAQLGVGLHWYYRVPGRD